VILPTVRRGSCTIGAGTTAVTCSINPPQSDLTRTFMVFQAVPGTDDTPNSSNVRCRLTSTSTIACSRKGTDLVDASVAWQTVELPGGITVQHVDAACTGTETTLSVPISAVSSTADTFVLLGHEEPGTSQDEDDMATVELTSPTNVNVTLMGGCGWDISLQVVELPGISVTAGRTLIAANSSSGSATGLLPAGLGSTIVLHSNQLTVTSATATCDRAVRGRVASDTSLLFTRGEGSTSAVCSATAATVAFQRIDFGSLATVQGPEIVMSPGGLIGNVTLSAAVDPTRTIVLSGGQAFAGQAVGETDYEANDVIGEAVALHQLTSTTNLRVTRGSANGSARFSSFVIQIE
jgi:hypothetical protein